MKKNLDKYVAIFAVIVLICSIVWISKSCEHKTLETGGFTYLYSLKEAKKASAEQSGDSVTKHDNEYQGNLHKYNNPDSIGRELLRAKIRRSVSDSIRKRALR